MYLDLVKIFVPTTFAFFLGIFITPLATHFFYKYKMWKKKARSEDITSADFKLIHQQKEETEISTPCVGGIVIWVSALFTVFKFFQSFANFYPCGHIYIGSHIGTGGRRFGN